MSDPHPIYVVSGGSGASGEQLVQTALAQFADVGAAVTVMAHVSSHEQIEEVIAQAAAAEGIIVHTLVDPNLRDQLFDLAREHSISTIDLMGPLLQQLTQLFDQEPLGQPGLYRKLRGDYFKRIDSIEFTVDHDDGRKPHELHLADIILTGVSRVGKTPLSIYLAMQGWKVANVPLVKAIGPPKELLELTPHRVIGLTIEPGKLIAYRRHRQKRYGGSRLVARRSDYGNAREIVDEVQYALELFHRHRFTVIDITDKPIEETAREIISIIQKA